MILKHITPLLIITFLLVACASPTPTAIPGVTGTPSIPPTGQSLPTQPGLPTQTSIPIPYPPPPAVTAAPANSAYPGPISPTTGTSAIPTSGYEPQSGDESLKRDQVNLDMAASHIVVTASEPAQAKAVLTGTMPDPCHSLRVVVTPADASNTIKLEVYSLVDPKITCVTKQAPFTASIPLGAYASGQYTVVVNDTRLGQFDTVFSPQPGDGALSRCTATVDMTSSNLNVSGTQPNKVNANLKGYLPDPCHKLRIVYTPADAQNKINLNVYSVYDSKAACITMIQPFNVIYPLGSFTTGHYLVYVNGELLGEFDGSL